MRKILFNIAMLIGLAMGLSACAPGQQSGIGITLEFGVGAGPGYYPGLYTQHSQDPKGSHRNGHNICPNDTPNVCNAASGNHGGGYFVPYHGGGRWYGSGEDYPTLKQNGKVVWKKDIDSYQLKGNKK